MNPASNKRTDKYGGSIENRARLLLRIIDKLIGIVGAEKLAVRLAPWSSFLGMEIEGEEIHSYILQQLQQRADNGQQLAYVSLIEPRVIGIFDASLEDQKVVVMNLLINIGKEILFVLVIILMMPQNLKLYFMI